MPALHIPHAANIVDASLATAAFTASTAPIRCRLMTANGSGTAAGTELTTGGGYTPGTGAPSVTFNAASTATGQATSSSAVTVSNMPSATITGVELWDSAGTPIRKWYGALSGGNKVVAAGDTFTIADAYLFVILSWMGKHGIDSSRWPGLAAFARRMSERPAGQKVLRAEGLVEAQAAS